MEDRPLEDRQLLQRFVRDHSQEAFAALTARYVSLVYAVCRRELADAETAEDVTQAVFLILARKAPSLGRHVVLSGWLFQTARFAAKNARLQAQRRAAYEQKAAEALMEQHQTEDAQWAEIEPLLNQSLAALKAGERECVLLRFFQGASFAEVGASLGLSEDAARKRVTRSLEKMRQFFTKNGVIVPAIALPVLLTAHAAKAVPAACQANIATLTHSVLAGHTTVALTGSRAYQLSEGTLKAMKIVQLKVTLGVTAAVLGAGTFAVVHSLAQPASKAPKSGPLLQQAPNKTLTVAQIVARCRKAYATLDSYQCTATSLTRNAGRADLVSSAHILFVRPRKIAVSGTDMGGREYAYDSDGLTVAAKDNGLTSNKTLPSIWKKVPSLSFELANAAAVTQLSATTVPSLLLGIKPLDNSYASYPFNGLSNEVHEDAVDGHLCYVVIAVVKSATGSGSRSFWVDEKTFLLRRYVAEGDRLPKTVIVDGKPLVLVEWKNHIDQQLTDERINQPIPDSTFALRAVQ